MRFFNKSFAIFMMFSLILVLLNILPTVGSPNSYGTFEPDNTLADDSIYNINITVTSPTSYNLTNGTPIIIKLSQLANYFPESADPFGLITPSEEDDDIKWDGSYVVYQGNLIPSQVDDIDDQIGFSGGDEILFQLPITLISDNSTVFSLYIGSKAVDLPEPRFEEVATVYEYPRIQEIKDQHGTEMMGESYSMENGVIRTTALVEAAWSSGGIFELSILESGWDTVKMGYKFDWETWKWTRWAGVEQFIENNQAFDVNPFFLVRIIKGPVRAQVQMQSTAPYGKAGSVWGTLPGVFGLVTYDMYANLPWLDYSLEMVGPNVANYDDYILQFWNREYGGGAYSTNQNVYIPGLGYLERNPDDILDRWYQKAQFTQSWFLEKIPAGGSYFCPGGCQPGDMPVGWSASDMLKVGHGMIFDDTGFSNMTWHKSAEWVRLWFNAMQSPFHARYLPFDKTITDDAVTYMGQQYQEYNNPDPLFSFTNSTISLLEVPFETITVNTPNIVFNDNSKLLQITNVTAFSSEFGVINDLYPSNVTFQILFANNKTQTPISGNLIWNLTGQTWEASNLDASTLYYNQTSYVVIIYVNTLTTSGKSSFSQEFTEIVIPPDSSSISTSSSSIPSTSSTSSTVTSISDTQSITTTPGFTLIILILIMTIGLGIRRKNQKGR